MVSTKFMLGLTSALLLACALSSPKVFAQYGFKSYANGKSSNVGTTNISQPTGPATFDSGHGKMPGVGQNTQVQNAQWQARQSMANKQYLGQYCPPAASNSPPYSNFQNNANNQTGYSQQNQPITDQWLPQPVESDNSPPPLDKNGKPKESGF